MSENSENKKEGIEEVKRGRGRPRKGSPPIVKEPKKIGRPKKYDEGYNDHKFPRLLVDRKEYKRLLDIEQKYLAIKNTIDFK
jgi:hypothetical protein